MKYYVLLCAVIFLVSCGNKNAITPAVITETAAHDTDDPAIWIHPEDVSRSLIIGTDKDSNGALYVFDLQGKIVHQTDTLKRPNNVDVAYSLALNDSITVDVAVATERDRNMIRVFSLPDMQAIDNGGIPVFTGEEQRSPMGISLYTRKDSLGKNEIFAVVGRKDGPSGTYLHQYLLKSDTTGTVTGTLVRKFGNYSGTKEIEAIAVDNELGYIYYSDEREGIRKYYADPEKGNEELAIFGTTGFKEDREGISIFKADRETGYIFVSNQSNRSFKVFPREGTADNRHAHPEIVDIPVKANQSDGSDVMNVNFGEPFSTGIFVAMSDDRTFHYYDWRKFQEAIDKAQATK
ncbi:MAG: phytase [Porphyromonadaceae bacterium]|nr:phytase [Porphyromonadaceae bacterium]